jgi:hypothetical protein
MNAQRINLDTVGELEIDTPYYTMVIRNTYGKFSRVVTWKVSEISGEPISMTKKEVEEMIERNRDFVSKAVHIEDMEIA